jgi:hypothetical protein
MVSQRVRDQKKKRNESGMARVAMAAKNTATMKNPPAQAATTRSPVMRRVHQNRMTAVRVLLRSADALTAKTECPNRAVEILIIHAMSGGWSK